MGTSFPPAIRIPGAGIINGVDFNNNNINNNNNNNNNNNSNNNNSNNNINNLFGGRIVYKL